LTLGSILLNRDELEEIISTISQNSIFDQNLLIFTFISGIQINRGAHLYSLLATKLHSEDLEDVNKLELGPTVVFDVVPVSA
jgi:hypothetical protein